MDILAEMEARVDAAERGALVLRSLLSLEMMCRDRLDGVQMNCTFLDTLGQRHPENLTLATTALPTHRREVPDTRTFLNIAAHSKAVEAAQAAVHQKDQVIDQLAIKAAILIEKWYAKVVRPANEIVVGGKAGAVVSRFAGSSAFT
ncbi:hypothetical protein PYCC9005_000844 [Savitreella phatthalungensis]